MHLVVVHKSTGSSESGSDSLLRLAFSGGPLTDVVIGGMSEYYGLHRSDLTFAVPDEWKRPGSVSEPGVSVLRWQSTFTPGLPVRPDSKSWFVISDGRFFSQTDLQLLYEYDSSNRF